MSREAILAKVRAGLGVKAADPERVAAARDYIAARERNLVPARASKPRAELIEQFGALLKGQSATVLTLDAPDQVPAAVAGYLRGSNLPARLRMGVDPWLAALPWDAVAGLAVLHGRAEGSDQVGLSRAKAGVSETGTLMLVSGASNPVTLAFVPETHIIVIAEDDITGSLEDGFDLIRERLGERVMPRTLNLISGPSRTADIGGRIVIGAHGPRRLAVLIVKNAKDA